MSKNHILTTSNNFVSKTIAPIIGKFHRKNDQTPGFFLILELDPVKNPRCPPLPKIAKTAKSTSQ